jgi:uncharacterized membrane protein YgaE (UPF0421/DUF939 family)
MDIRRRPGLLFLYVGVSLLALGSLLRRFVLPPTEYEFLLVSVGAFLATILVTYLLYDPTEVSTETEWRY